MGKGDEVIAAGQAQRWYDEHGDRCVIVDLKGRHRWDDIWEGNPVIVKPGEDRPGDHILLSAPNARPYIVYPFTSETGWTFNRSFRAREVIAKIYLTPDEQAITETWKAFAPGRFVLFDPWSKHPNLRWPIDHWVELIRLNPDLQFVQQSYPLGYAHALPNVTVVPTHSFREACALLAACSVYIRGESGMCHAAAALDIPNVTIWGGCMDWEVLGGYPKQIGVGVPGLDVPAATPCGSYKPCGHCRDTMAAISPEVVSAALRRALAGDFKTTG